MAPEVAGSTPVGHSMEDEIRLVRAYVCQFAKCWFWADTPQKLSQHYVDEHGAVMPEKRQETR